MSRENQSSQGQVQAAAAASPSMLNAIVRLSLVNVITVGPAFLFIWRYRDHPLSNTSNTLFELLVAAFATAASLQWMWLVPLLKDIQSEMNRRYSRALFAASLAWSVMAGIIALPAGIAVVVHHMMMILPVGFAVIFILLFVPGIRRLLRAGITLPDKSAKTRSGALVYILSLVMVVLALAVPAWIVDHYSLDSGYFALAAWLSLMALVVFLTAINKLQYAHAVLIVIYSLTLLVPVGMFLLIFALKSGGGIHIM